MNYRNFIKTYLLPFLVFLILCSSIGISSYSHLCCCSKKVYNSVFLQTKIYCCKQKQHHQHKEKDCHAAKSCKVAPQKKKCCDTTFHLATLDWEAILDFLVDDLEEFQLEKSIYPTILTRIASISISDYGYKSLCPLDLQQTNAPPLLETVNYLQFIQCMRC